VSTVRNPDSVREQMRRIYNASTYGRDVSRSHLYAYLKALPLAAELDRRGLVVNERDAETGRKVRSIVWELGRLLPPKGEPLDDELREALVDLYLTARTWPIATVRQRVSRVQRAEAAE